jgi:hypothetical protein
MHKNDSVIQRIPSSVPFYFCTRKTIAGSDGKRVIALKELEKNRFLIQVKLNAFENNFVSGNIGKVVLL